MLLNHSVTSASMPPLYQVVGILVHGGVISFLRRHKIQLSVGCDYNVFPVFHHVEPLSIDRNNTGFF